MGAHASAVKSHANPASHPKLALQAHPVKPGAQSSASHLFLTQAAPASQVRSRLQPQPSAPISQPGSSQRSIPLEEEHSRPEEQAPWSQAHPSSPGSQAGSSQTPVAQASCWPSPDKPQLVPSRQPQFSVPSVQLASQVFDLQTRPVSQLSPALHSHPACPGSQSLPLREQDDANTIKSPSKSAIMVMWRLGSAVVESEVVFMRSLGGDKCCCSEVASMVTAPYSSVTCAPSIAAPSAP